MASERYTAGAATAVCRPWSVSTRRNRSCS